MISLDPWYADRNRSTSERQCLVGMRHPFSQQKDRRLQQKLKKH